MTTADEAFERAFVAVSFSRGVRGEELTAPLGSVAASTLDLCARLAHPDRQIRAKALAVELGAIAVLLDSVKLR